MAAHQQEIPPIGAPYNAIHQFLTIQICSMKESIGVPMDELEKKFLSGGKIKLSRKFNPVIVTLETSKTRELITKDEFSALKAMAKCQINSNRTIKYGDRTSNRDNWGKPLVETFFAKTPTKTQRKRAESATF